MSENLDLDHCLTKALADYTAGHLDLAEAGFRSVLGQSPDDPDALNLLGLVMQGRGDPQQSIALIQRALEIDPDFPEALTNLARVQRFIGQPARAADAAERAVALDPDLAEAHLQLGHARLDLGDNGAAVTALRQATVLAPDLADAWAQLGLGLLRLSDLPAAVEALAVAHRLRPDRADSMINLGVALVGLGRLDEARDWHQKAVSLAPDDVNAHAALAVTQRRRFDPAASMVSCRRALELSPAQADLWVLLGTNLASTGQFAEAETCYLKALELNADLVEARRNLVMIGQHASDAAEMERLRTTLDNPAVPVPERISAGFAFGTALDRAGQYDSAFAVFQAANRLKHSSQNNAGTGFDAANLRQFVDWATATFNPDAFTATAGWGDPSEQPVFIVGMPRSGTSLVEQIAAGHPRVFGVGERKDIGDIVQSLDGGPIHRPPGEWSRDTTRTAAARQIYRLRSLGGSAERVIDKLPDNCQFLGQIAVLFPNARIIICRRDLRDVCLSCYFQRFDDGMTWTFDQVDLAMRAREIERLVAHWRTVLPLKMLEVQYEDLVGDLEGESRRLIDFLGLEWDPACLAFHSTDRPVMTASYWQVRQPMYSSSVGRWKHYRRQLQPLLAGLVDLVPPDGDIDWDAVAADPTTALTIAAAHHRDRRYAAAEPLYRAVLRSNPDDARALHMLGALLLDSRSLTEAVSMLTRSVALRPDFAPALADLAAAHRATGDSQAAFEAARRAIALDPDLPDAQVQFGCALVMQQDFAGARDVLQRVIAIAPRSLEAKVGLAAALGNLNDHRGAAEAWQAALTLKPDDPDLLLELASACFSLRRYVDALATFRQVDALRPGEERAVWGIATSLLQQGHADAAAVIARRALETTPDVPRFWLLLGNCENVMGHFDLAADAYRRALSLDPNLAEALNGLVAAGAGLDGAGAAVAAAIVNDPLRSSADRVFAGFALGREYARNRAYDEAFRAYAEANALLKADRARRGFTFDRDGFRSLVDHMVAQIGPQAFQDTAGWGHPSEVPVFIVGMPRSGTTLVEQIAASHPLVHGAGEMNDVFDSLTVLAGERWQTPPKFWDRPTMQREALSYVQRLTAMDERATRVIDKLPDNILALGQIAVMFPNARIVVCRRDPRDVGLSCFFQYFRDDTMAWTDDLADCAFRAQQTERLLDHWKRVMPLPMLEVQYETLVADIEHQSRRLIEFLGLEWDPACLSFHDTDRAVRTASHWQVRQPLYSSSVGRWRDYRKHLGPLLEGLTGLVPATDGH